MLSYIRAISVLSLVTLLMGCSHIYGENGMLKDRDNDYLKAQNIAPIQVPPGYGSQNIQAHYPVSEKQYTTNMAKVDLLPPGLAPDTPNKASA
jgi:uncharacterized lipoprotein